MLLFQVLKYSPSPSFSPLRQFPRYLLPFFQLNSPQPCCNPLWKLPTYFPQLVTSVPLPQKLSSSNPPSQTFPVNFSIPFFLAPYSYSPLKQYQLPTSSPSPCNTLSLKYPLKTTSPAVQLPYPFPRPNLTSPWQQSPFALMNLPKPWGRPLKKVPQQYPALGQQFLPYPCGLLLYHSPSYTTPVLQYRKNIFASAIPLSFFSLRQHSNSMGSKSIFNIRRLPIRLRTSPVREGFLSVNSPSQVSPSCLRVVVREVKWAGCDYGDSLGSSCTS